MRQQARDSARESAPRGSDRSATNHNTLQARETAANQRPHDRMGRQQNAGIVFGEIHLNETTLQSSIGYSRVWTEGVLCLILARLVDPRNGSARQLSKGNRATRRDREDSCPQRVVQNRSQLLICRLERVAGRGSAHLHRSWRATSVKNPAPCTAGGGFKLSSPRSLGRNGRWRGRRSVLTTAPGATADTTDTRPRHVGFAADPFWYHVLGSARAIVFEWCGATRAGIAILSRGGTVRCRLCRGFTPRVATRR